MALGARELLLVIRARDEASRAMHSLSRSMNNVDKDTRKAAAAQIERGRALSSIGVGMMAVGAAGAKVLYDWTKAAMDYNKESAKTLTQVDKQKISLQDIKKVGEDVAKAIPAPFKEMQGSLYDIFSSMDVNLSEAKTLLTAFSKAAVGGQVSLQDASRATIGILNAYQMKAKDVNKVNDVMFQLVRKGVGTYAQFATTIGRAVPSAVRAGQSIEQLSGMLAFLTRNGLSAAMASASAARALDAISNPKTIGKFSNLSKAIDEALGSDRVKQLKSQVKNFDDLSVAVVGANGKFRPMNKIMTDLGNKFRQLKLTGPEVAAVLQELFKGSGGTIQARRFFDIAVKNTAQLNSLTKDLTQSQGALNSAYDKMAKQPASKIQLLKNNFEILKVEMGDALLPVVTKFITALTGMFKWFNNLSPGMKKFIAYTTLILTVLTIVAGAVLVVVGGIMMLAGAAAAVGVSLGMVAAIAALVVAVIAAIGVAVFFIIKYWKQISGFFVGLWNGIVSIFTAAWNRIMGVINTFWPPIWNIIKTGWNVVVTIFKLIAAIIITIVLLWWRAQGKPIMEFFQWVWGYIKAGWNIVVTLFNVAWKLISSIAKTGWGWIKSVTIGFWNWIKPYIQTGTKIITQIWTAWFGPLKATASAAWNIIKSGVSSFWNWQKQAWQGGVKAITSIWNSIKKPLAGPVNFLINTIWNNGIAKAWNTAVDMVNLPSKYKAPHLGGISAATGGHIKGPGGPTDDKIPAWLSDGEFVVRASQTRKWLPVLRAINNGMNPRGGALPGFAGGGLIGKIKDAGGFLMDVITNPVGAMKKALSHAVGSLASLQGSKWGQIIAAVPKRVIDMLVEGFKTIWKKFGAGTGNAAKAIAFARAQIGKWYQWGATGPNTYDCSGLTFKSWLAAGKNIGRTTYAQRATLKTIGGPIPGAMGQPHPGHTYMATRINPTYVVEAAQTGTRISEHLLTRSTPWWGYPKATGGFINASRMLSRGRMARRILGPNFIYNPRAMQTAKWLGLAGDPGGVVPGMGPIHTALADSGAYVRPGMNAILNHTGGRERVLTPAETRAYERGLGNAMPPIIINTQEISPRRHAAELGWELNRRVT